ncbi:cytochrome P450 [Jatrophihabitans sp.]|uniref:cytochrome P450 n=1 Tax=Jatrophihabitans sp. TaxID=1932789 RepID=UPI0030C7246F
MTDEVSIRLTSQRDPHGHVAPGSELRAARDGGSWPTFEYREPGVHTDIDHASAITSYRDVRELLGSTAIINGQAAYNVAGSRAQQPGNLLFKNGAEHRRLRRILIRHFTVKRVAALRPRVEELVDGLLDTVAAQGPGTDLIENLTRPLPALVFCELMGVPYTHHQDILGWTQTLLSLDASFEENHAAAAAIKDFLTEIVRRVTREPGADLMSAIVAEGGDDLSEDEAVGMGTILLVAGMDTTSHSTALSILTLLQQPDQLAIVRAAGGLAEPATDELIRYLSPVPAAQLRCAAEDITLGENTLRAGDRVMFSLLAANWDPELIGSAPELDLTRPRPNHVGFGYGFHQCPGQHLARLEVSVTVTKLFERFPALAAVTDDSLDWNERGLIYGINRLPVTW